MTEADVRTAVPVAFRSFFDDAATFPPGLQPLDRAVTDHVMRWKNPLSAAVGPAVLNLKDLPEARRMYAEVALEGRALEVSAVVPVGQIDKALAAVGAAGPEMRVAALELKTEAGQDIGSGSHGWEAAAAAGLDVYVELASGQISDGALELLAAKGLRLKYRTGGIEARLFPSTSELAAVIVAAVSSGVAFKLTAGLHEAVRYRNPATEFTHHGFLNIAAATCAARVDEPLESVEALLGETDASALVERVAAGDAWRESFRSFGTCSVGEPAASLAELGLFPPGLE